ncbi:MAG TPA: polysaccharide deacetylase family protein [Terriglobales bacterium]|nr:polysaccharide deacetylase family protein [Terriglobales bacterium]
MTDLTTTRFVTISVDDGDPRDFRTADLLKKYGLEATFYIPSKNPERPVMTENQVRELAGSFEIGAHTVNHLPLKAMPDSQAFEEISGGKRWLEDLLGKPCVSFCYPRGKFNSSTPGLIKKAGFLGARTCLFNLTTFPQNPFLWGLSTHAYSHSKMIQLRHAALEGNYRGLVNFLSTYKGTTDWQQHFHIALDHVEQNGGIAHLYFHSWEIDELKQWDRLEATLAAISQRQGFTRVTNGELFAMWKAQLDSARN